MFCADMGRLRRIRVFAVQAAGWRLSEAFAVSLWAYYFPKNSLIWRHCRIAVVITRKRLRLCGKGLEEILGRPYFGESPVQGRHECFMYRCGGDVFPVPWQIPRGAGVMQERDVIAVVSGGPYARVDAHVAYHSAADEFPYVRLAEGVVEIRLEKSVRRVFDDDEFAGQQLDRAVNLPTGRTRQEEGRAGTGVDMSDVKNGPVRRPRPRGTVPKRRRGNSRSGCRSREVPYSCRTSRVSPH